MPIAMRCPGCDTKFEFDSDLEGKRIKCKSCGDIFRVERPSKAVKKRRDDDEDEDDRPRTKRRKDEDEDDRRPPSRSRRAAAVDDDDDDRPRSRRRDEDDEEDDLPPKKKSKALLFALIGGGAFLLLIVGVVVIIFMKGKKGPGGVDEADLVKAPTRSCPVEVKETEIDLLVIPDSGNTFGILRKTDTVKKNWAWSTNPPDPSSSARRANPASRPARSARPAGLRSSQCSIWPTSPRSTFQSWAVARTKCQYSSASASMTASSGTPAEGSGVRRSRGCPVGSYRAASFFEFQGSVPDSPAQERT